MQKKVAPPKIGGGTGRWWRFYLVQAESIQR